MSPAPALVLGAMLLVACGEPIPGASNGPLIPERQVIAKGAETPGRVLRDRGVLILETRGTLFQAGVQQGTLMRDRLRDLIRDYHERRAFSAFVLTPGFVHRFYASRQARHLSPDERDFLRGLAAGSGFSQNDLLLLSTDPPYTAFSNRLPGLVTGGGTFIARGKATHEGGTLLGRISDDLTFGMRQRYTMLWVHHPESAPAWVALTRVGSLAAEAAWNENGLFAAIDPVPGSPKMAGLPPRWLTLRLMNAEGPDVAEAELRKAAASTGQAFVGTLAMGEGARMVEAAGGRVGVRSYGSGGALPDLADGMGVFKAKDLSKGGKDPRDERFGKLLAAQYGQLDPQRAMTVLSDLLDPVTQQRGPTPLSVSRALPLRMALGPVVLGDWGSLNSTTALVAQPKTRRLWVSLGHDQIDDAQKFVDFQLDTLLAGEANSD
ncbi:hypothetical protein D3C87_734850 [compost metagenome]